MNPDQIQAQVTEFEQALTGRRDLTDHAKRVTAARNRIAAGERMRELQAAEQERRGSAQRAADRKLFGNTGSTDPNTLMLRRDAAERAGRITDHGELRQALHAAERDGDTVMAQALAARAGDVWAFDIVNEYIASNPQAQQAVQDMQEPRTDPIHEAAQYALPPAVGVLSGLEDWQISSLAADELEAS